MTQERQYDDVEVVDADTIEDTGDDEEELEEEVVPPQEEKPQEVAPKEEEEEELDEDKEDEQPSEDSDKDTPKEEQEEIKPVEGETPKERALRLEVTRLRKKNRGESEKELLKTDDTPPKTEDYLASLREKYSEEDLADLEKVIEAKLAAKGVVTRSETVAEKREAAFNEWVTEHPEYDPDKDKDDLYWNTFTGILAADYNLPKNVTTLEEKKQFKRVLDKAHRDAMAELGVEESSTTDRKTEAAREKVRSARAGGGSGRSGESEKPQKKETPTVDPAVRAHFKGFDDEDLI